MYNGLSDIRISPETNRAQGLCMINELVNLVPEDLSSKNWTNLDILDACQVHMFMAHYIPKFTGMYQNSHNTDQRYLH